MAVGRLPTYLSARWGIALACVVALAGAGAAVVVAQDDAEPAASDAPHDDGGRLDEVANALACDSLSGPLRTEDLMGDAVRHVCTASDVDVALVHSFPPEDRASVVARVEPRLDNATAVPCEDGQPPGPGPWILIGDDWAVSSYEEQRVRRVEAALGGEYVGGGAVGEAAPVGPPASFEVPNACR